MLTVDFMSQLRNLGIKVWVENESLRYQAPKGAVTPELLKELGARKQEIIAFIKQVNAEAQAVQETIPSLPRSADGQSQLPLSYSQHSMWFFDQFTKGNPVFNIANAVRMKGNLDRNVLRTALNTVVARHEALRTTFKNQEGTPLQVVSPPAGVEIPTFDLTQIPEAQLENTLQQTLTREARRSFDLESGPLFRFILFLLSEDEAVLSLTTHHIISDAWSNGIFVGEFLKLYEMRVSANLVGGTTSDLPNPPIQFADYAAWQKDWLDGEGASARLEPLLNYWRGQLAHPTTLQLPTDHPRPKSQVYEGGLESVSLSMELTQQLKALAGQEGATLFMVLLAVFQLLLHRYSGQTDIFTGTVVANRNRKEIEYMVGYVMNTLVLRTDFSGDPDFPELLRRVKKMVLDAYQYQEI
ncbi:MAG TPA: condensation domain-containing protein, partial [Bacillota bacterium]|nr:condensation domain-containing protein [Bacillota bacterium]